MKKLFTMLSVVCALFAGCSSDDTGDKPPKPELTISSEDASVTIDPNGSGAAVAAGAEGLSVTLGIATNLKTWTLSDEIPGWIEIDRGGGIFNTQYPRKRVPAGPERPIDRIGRKQVG